MKTRFAHILFALPVLGLPVPVFAMDQNEVHDLQVSRRGDLEMSCGELSQEAALMKDIIRTTQDIRDQSQDRENGIGVAGAAASFLVGTLTGGLGIAAAGYFAGEAVEAKGENAESVQDIAEQRRSFITGIYNSKGCAGPIDPEEEIENAKAEEEKEIAEAEPAAGAEKPAQASYNE